MGLCLFPVGRRHRLFSTEDLPIPYIHYRVCIPFHKLTKTPVMVPPHKPHTFPGKFCNQCLMKGEFLLKVGSLIGNYLRCYPLNIF